MAQYLARSMSDQSKKLDSKTTEVCIRILGDVTSHSESLCSYLLQTEQFQLLPTLQNILVTPHKDEQAQVLWMLSNFVLNSSVDCKLILNSGIMTLVVKFGL